MRTWIVIALALTACKQSEREGWKQVCKAADECCAKEQKSPDRAMHVATWTMDHVSNAAVKKELQALGDVERADDRRQILEADVREAGLDPADCAILHDL